jgi:hypothetical protein
MKIQDIITESSLTEFAPGGADSGGPYAYGMALKELAKLYAEEDLDRPATSSAEQDSSDAYEIDECADAFLTKGMEAGREAYMMISDVVQEEMDEFLADQGFDVDNDIYAEYKKDIERYNQSPGGKAAQSQSDADAQKQAKLAQERKDNKVIIELIDPETGEARFESIQFDQRSVAPGQLQAEINQEIDKLKKRNAQRYPNDLIRVTIGGKPVG